MAMRRKRSDPMLLGEPSPSLTKINKMPVALLGEHVKALAIERERLVAKLVNLEAHKPRPDAKIEVLKKQVARLQALEDAAKRKSEGKPILPQQPIQSQYSRRPYHRPR